MTIPGPFTTCYPLDPNEARAEVSRSPVSSNWRARRSTHCAQRHATRETVMLPRAASVREKPSSSSASEEDIGMRIPTNWNSFPRLVKRAAFCLRNAPHRWWNPGEGLLISTQIRGKRRTSDICQRTEGMIHTRVPVNAFDARTELWARLNTLTGSSALTSLPGHALRFQLRSAAARISLHTHTAAIQNEIIQ